MAHGVKAPPPESLRERARLTLQHLRYLPRTFALVKESSRAFAAGMIALLLGQAALPAAMAWVGKLIVDAVVAAARSGDPAQRWHVLRLVALEAGLMAVSTAMSRGQALLRDLMRASLGNHVNTLILEKAATLELRHFEDAGFYDKMQNARREASIRPLSMALETASLLQQLLILASYAALLVRLSPWSVLLIVVASVPSFIAEARFSGESFRLNTWRAPEGRRQNYLEWILTRDSHVKEVKLFDLAPLVLRRYKALFEKFYAEDRALALRKGAAGIALGLLSLAAFYGAYAFMAVRAALGAITLGDLTLYLSVFRQGQSSIQSALASIGSLYEDGLFMSNLFDYLDIGTGGEQPRRLPPLSPAPARSQEIEFRDVSFRYPGSEKWVLRGVSLRLAAGEKMALVGENGAGKSTLIKLLMRLYDPSEGAILYGGVDLRDMDARDLRDRIGVLFQDFVRYQWTARENVGIGWVPALDDRPRIERAVDEGGARQVIEQLPQKIDTMLGGWFEEGQELSGGQWQKIALARAFMRHSEVLVLDEPTAALDAEAEHELFVRLQQLAADRTAILISHRFSTVRRADRIAVLQEGRVEELGTHEELLARGGRYAHLFKLQASGYVS
ncbi:MAG TPA: ABC transporter ATP-binding protein [Myxococcales bacterium]|nr:ABC transporter ATP-binding protein [Myxococcales bacterium]